MNIGFIGFGNMAKAIAQGLLKQKSYSLFASSPSLSDGKTENGVTTHPDNKITASRAEVIILAVKPKSMAKVLQDINPVLKPDGLLISIAAGLTLPWLSTHCPAQQAIIRCMPNTPATVSEAATVLMPNAYANPEQKKTAEQIFSSIGIINWLKLEAEFDAYTALSGSGPAYVFKFVEGLIAAAETLGLDQNSAKTFALQTVKGAVILAEQSQLSLSDLRNKVTSPGGTTAAALDILNRGEFDSIICEAMQAAQKHSIELSLSE